MSNLTQSQLQSIMVKLRNVAERHPDDVIANKSSDFAWRLEAAGGTYGPSMDPSKWTPLQQQLARHAIKWNKEQAHV